MVSKQWSIVCRSMASKLAVLQQTGTNRFNPLWGSSWSTSCNSFMYGMSGRTLRKNLILKRSGLVYYTTLPIAINGKDIKPLENASIKNLRRRGELQTFLETIEPSPQSLGKHCYRLKLVRCSKVSYKI